MGKVSLSKLYDMAKPYDVSIPYGEGKTVKDGDTHYTLVYQSPMGKVGRERLAKESNKHKYQSPMGKVSFATAAGGGGRER